MATGKRKPGRHRSVRAILLARLFVVLVPIVLLQAWVYLHDYRAKRDAELQANLEIARAVAASFDAFLDDLAHEEKAVGQGLLLLAPFSKQQANWYLAQVKKAYPEVVSVSWLEPDGRVAASSESQLLGRQWPDRSWLGEIMRGRQSVVTNVTRPPDAKEARFSVARRARDETGALRGIVVAVVDPNRLDQVITIKRSGAGAVSIVDSSGWLTFRLPAIPLSYQERDWGKLYRVVRGALEGRETKLVEYVGYQKGPRVVAAVPIRSVGWAASAGRPEEEAIAPIKAGTARSAVAFLLVGTLGVLLATAAARSITVPLTHLRERALAFGRGDVEERAELRGPSDLVDLAGAFNQMADEIGAREQALRESERARAAEARLLDTILTATDSRLAYLDRDLRYVRVNAAYAANARMAPEDFVGRHRLEVFPNAPEVAAMYQRVLDTGAPDAIPEYTGVPLYRPEVGPRCVRIEAVPIRNERGEADGLVTSMMDITDQVQTREKLLEAERARARLAETLVSEIGHRTKNNLAIVAGLLQMQMDREAGRISGPDLIRDAVTRILSFAALHEQMYQSRTDTIELVNALRRIGDVNRQALSAGDVVISVEGEPVHYPSDVGTNICVVANELLTNAIKHGGSQDGARQVEVQLSHAAGMLTLSIWDSGNPIPEDFDLGRWGKTGLGLVRTIVEEQYGGSLTLVPHQGGTLAQIVLDDRRVCEGR